MAMHIKDIVKLLDCVKEAKKILTGLSGDDAISLSRISKWQNDTNNLLKEVEDDTKEVNFT